MLIVVEDSGEGFEWNKVSMVGWCYFVYDESFGCGLFLFYVLCEWVWFENGGSKVICLFDIKI